MNRILHIEASPRRKGSVSRALAREFLEAWSKSHPGAVILHRDLAASPPSFIMEEWIGAAFGPDPTGPDARKVLTESDALINELLSADRLVLSTPMHNFNIPAALKAWIDQVVRPGRTFRFGPEGPQGLLPPGLKGLIITARGGVYAPGTPAASADHQEPFLRTLFGFMGLKDLSFVHAEGLNLSGDAAARGIEAARRRLAVLAESW